MVRSAFMGTFGEEAMKWLSLLTAPQYDYIVAIARKCPRLIDVILRESKTFSPSIWDKVITEHALPFHFAYLQLIIPQYFISNKSGIWSLSLIVHSKG